MVQSAELRKQHNHSLFSIQQNQAHKHFIIALFVFQVQLLANICLVFLASAKYEWGASSGAFCSAPVQDIGNSKGVGYMDKISVALVIEKHTTGNTPASCS